MYNHYVVIFVIYLVIFYIGYNHALPIIVKLIDPKRIEKFEKINILQATLLILFLYILSTLILGEPFYKI